MVHTPVNWLVGRNRRQVAPVVGQVIDKLTVGVEVQLSLLRLVTDNVAVQLDLAALGLQRFTPFDEVFITVPRLIKGLININQAIFLEFFPGGRFNSFFL